MYQRLDEDRPFSYPMIRSVPAMCAGSERYRRKLEPTPKGVAVTETADESPRPSKPMHARSTASSARACPP